MLPKIKVGLVGFGISAKVFHAPFLTILPEFELACVVERTKNDSQLIYPGVQVVRTIDELIADPALELIVITTPNETHVPYAMKALEGGKHVVLEKPFANNSKEAMELVELARNSGKILSVYQNRRYVSDFLTIRQIIDRGLLGKVHEFIAHYDRYREEPKPNAWREEVRPGSGILHDLGPHLVDQALSLFGLPRTITADIRMQRPHSKVNDYFDLQLDYGFLKVMLHAGMLVREHGPRYMIHGTKGSYIKHGEDPQEAALRAGQSPVGEDWGREPDVHAGLLHTEIDGKIIRENYPTTKGDYGNFYKGLYTSIVEGRPVKEKPEHGYNTVRLIELAFESNENKCTIPCSGLLDVSYAY
jgi:predicted dehydrogenase